MSEVVTKVSALNLFIFELVLEYFSNGIEFQIVAVVYFSLWFFPSVNGFNWSLAIFKLLKCYSMSRILNWFTCAEYAPINSAARSAFLCPRNDLSRVEEVFRWSCTGNT